MPQTRIAEREDLKVRITSADRRELEILASKFGLSLAGAVRLTLRAGFPAVRSLPTPGLTDPHEVMTQ